jgi:hypothetical protein
MILTIDVPLMSPAELLLDHVELKMLDPAERRHHQGSEFRNGCTRVSRT